MLTEVGYPSVDGGAVWPWDYTRGGAVDVEEQRRGFAALARAWAGHDLAGLFVWGVERLAEAAEKLNQFERNGNLWWTIPENEFRNNSGLDGFDRSREDKIDLLNGNHDGYVLTSEWWLQGELPVLEDQLKLMQFGEGEDFGEPIRAMVDELCRQLQAQGPPKMIKYYTESSWQENIDNREQQYANDNGTRRSFEINFGNLVLENGTESGSAGPVNGTFRLVLGGMPANEDPAKKSESGDAIGGALNRQTITLMMPMPLAERNEDGYRIELNRRKDLEKVIEVMILKSISESFSRQLFVYTQSESSLRVLLGVYPTARDDPTPKKK